MKVLIIQTAFLGDVILATPLIESLHNKYPESTIDFLLKKGNKPLLDNHPFIGNLFIFDKKNNKASELLRLIKLIRKERYDHVINLQRFFSSGLITFLSKGKTKTGFDKNPMSFSYNIKKPHSIGKSDQNIHEVDRNLSLIDSLTQTFIKRPKLYPSKEDFEKVKTDSPYICIAPASIWFTKQYPKESWIHLLDILDGKLDVYITGGPEDIGFCEEIKVKTKKGKIINMAGKLSLLESAALMKNAVMNFVNDSAPLHLASAMNAPVTAIFCSTIPGFGFYPLSDISYIMESENELPCRPCGLHGKKACPLSHFNCSEINTDKILKPLFEILEKQTET